MRKIGAIILSLAIFGVLFSGCNTLIKPTDVPTIDVSTIKTQAAKEVLTDLTANAPTETSIPTPNPTITPKPTVPSLKCSIVDFSSSDWVTVNNTGTSEFLATIGKIEIIAHGGNQDLYYGSSMGAPRIIKRFETGNFKIITHVKIPENYEKGGFQGAGLLIFFNNRNYAWVALSAFNKIETAYTLMGNRKPIFKDSLPVPLNQYYLAFKTEGTKLFAGYSEDGINWIWSDAVVFDTSNIRAGLTVISAWEAPGYSAEFDCFEYMKN
jgi:hypothetical protein